MAIFNPGTGGDLTAITLESAILEMAALVDVSERAQLGNENFTPALTLAISVDDQQVTINYTPPLTNTVENDGTVKVVASDYLGLAVNGGGGDLNSTTAAAALMELIQLAANAEQGTEVNNAVVSFDLEANIADIAVTLPATVTAAGVNGTLSVAANEYLA